MKKSIKYLLLSLLLTIPTLSSCGAQSQAEYYEQKDVHALSFEIIGGRNVMPVGAYYGPNETDYKSENANQVFDFVSDEFYSLVDAAGINFLCSTRDFYELKPQSVRKGLELSEKYNMGYFVMDSTIWDLALENPADFEKVVAERISEYSGYKSYLGQVVYDEPQTKQFDAMARTYRAIEALNLDEAYGYSNLFPVYNSRIDYTGTAEVIDYAEYVERYLATVKPKMISYDHYLYTTENTVVDNIYFENMSIVREKAEKYGIPFWTFIQCGGQWTEKGNVARPDPIYPNEGEFIWNVNTCLAYGAKGIQYFTLTQPPWFSETQQGLNYEINGMVGALGNINRWYYYAQKANTQIQAIDHVLMNAYNYGVKLGGKAAKDITGSEVVKGAFRELQKVQGDAIVGCFDYFGKTALYVVNYSRTEKQSVALGFDGKYGMEVTQRATLRHYAGKSVKLTLEAGEGALIVLS